MYILDTNVISELRRIKPHGAVVEWVKSVNDDELFISVVTLAEIQSGIEITRDQDEKRAAELEQWLDAVAASYNILRDVFNTMLDELMIFYVFCRKE